MKKFLETTASWSIILFFFVTFLILCSEPPTGPADEPYIEYEMFVKNWGKIILFTWVGLLVTAIVSGTILNTKYKL